MRKQPPLQIFGQGRLADLVDDFLVFRSLEPVDPRLPGLGQLRDDLELPAGVTPRKIDPLYGQAVALILEEAARLLGLPSRIRRILYLGDTRSSDLAAFRNICLAGGWPGAAFIGCEKPEPAAMQVAEEGELIIIQAERWEDLAFIPGVCSPRGQELGRDTAVVLDLDKTSLGARGRNDQVINQARMAAVEAAVGEVLGGAFQAQAFSEIYGIINQDQYHGFTADNQDFVAYLCILLSGGMMDLEELLGTLERDQGYTFRDFVLQADNAQGRLDPGVAEFQAQFSGRYLAGDPTPFKEFRRQEYLETASRMGTEQINPHPEDLLREKITLTSEVYFQARRWKQEGWLVFGLSDKPDEASLPGDIGRRQGQQPIHKIPAWIVGRAGEGNTGHQS